MFNSYGESIAAALAMFMVLISANWLWEQLFTRLTQNLI